MNKAINYFDIKRKIETMLEAMRQRSDLECRERSVHSKMMDKKYELLQLKFERMQLVMDHKLAA